MKGLIMTNKRPSLQSGKHFRSSGSGTRDEDQMYFHITTPMPGWSETGSWATDAFFTTLQRKYNSPKVSSSSFLLSAPGLTSFHTSFSCFPADAMKKWLSSCLWSMLASVVDPIPLLLRASLLISLSEMTFPALSHLYSACSIPSHLKKQN